MNHDLTVEIVHDDLRFDALEPEWNDLLAASAADSPFLTWEWLHAWWTHLRGRSRLRLFTLREGAQLVAVAPLRRTRDRLPWFSRLEFLGTGNAGSDYLDLIVRRGFEVDAIGALATAVEGEGLALRLNNLPPASLAVRLSQRLGDDGWTARRTESGVCPLIHLEGHTWDSYLGTRGAAHRANVRRRMRTLARTFDVRFEQVASTTQRLEVLNALAAFHQRRFTGSRGTTAFRADLCAFQQAATESALRAGWLRLYALYLNDRIAGAMYAFSYDRRFFFYQHGFDEQYQQYGLGLLLMALTIAAAIEEGAKEFDLLWGTESYKWLWADDRRPLTRLDLFPDRIGGWINRQRMDAEQALRTAARRLSSRKGHAA